MSAVASITFAMIASILMQREGVIAIQVIAYRIWFFLSKYVNHCPRGKMLFFDDFLFFLF